MSQPSLSQQIRQLEEGLGLKLFDRGRQTQLTAVGEMFVLHSQHLVDAATRAQREVAGGMSLDGGKLTVAFITSLGRLNSSAVSQFTLKFLRIKINLHEQMDGAFDQLLLAGEIDLPSPLGASRHRISMRPFFTASRMC